MRRIIVVFLQIVVVLIGIGMLTLLLWEPHLEGRNVHATLFQIYFNDPFLAYIYLAFIPFFVGLYQVLKLLGYVGLHQKYSPASMNALRTIKRCAFVMAGFITGAEAWLFIYQRGKEDIAGGVAIGLLIIFFSIAVATTALVLERTVQKTLRS
jgi:hypothetical protein